MSELINPLFEEEKEFLEHKKLEYERALRGDVEHIKEQTVQVGKLALIGAGVAGGIWLLRKAFGRRKRSSAPHKEHYEGSYSGFGDDGDDYAEKLGSDHKWRGWDLDEEPHHYADRAEDDYPGLHGEEESLDDNGLNEFPDFAAHSGPHHGSDRPADYYEAPAGTVPADVYHTDGPAASDDQAEGAAPPAAERRFWSEEHSHPTANRAYDDSRRLPKSDSFADLTPAEDLKYASPPAKKSPLGPAITAFMQSEAGRVILGQAAAVAMALVTKVIKDMLPGDASETAKSSDLATPTVAAGAHTYDRPAVQAVPQSPVLDAQDPDADATIAPRQPLA